MKKILLTLGTIALSVVPITTMISCGDPTDPDDGDPINTNLENPFKDIKEDGLYLWDKTYDGTLMNNQTILEGIKHEGIQQIGITSGYALSNTVQLGKRDLNDKKQIEDSIYMVYDNDNNDGINMDNFTDTFFFEDTSVAMESEIYKLNHDVFGNYTASAGFGQAEYIKFHEGKTKYKGEINGYFGSQNNHVSTGEQFATSKDFQDRMKDFVEHFKESQPDAVNTFLKYYGLKTVPDKNGFYLPNPSLLTHANLGFAPVFYRKPVFTYEKIFDNVLKITYHDSDTFQCTAAHFRLKVDNKYIKYGSLSLGNNDWSSYYKHPEAEYVATKSDKVGLKPVEDIYNDINPIVEVSAILDSYKKNYPDDATVEAKLKTISNLKNVKITRHGPPHFLIQDDEFEFELNGRKIKVVYDGLDFHYSELQ